MQTRRYAKRQLTWFRRDSEINWFYIDAVSDDKLLADTADLIKKVLFDEKR
jgi:tRNA dimethylallyltransferase